MNGRTAARVTVCTLLAVSGGVTIAADAQRWWPCRPYAFDAPQCARLQSDFYDYVDPNSSWIPIGSAAQVAGIGMLLLAVAVLALPRVLTPEAPRWLTWGLGVLMSCGVAVVGAITGLAGLVGHPVADSLLGPFFAVWVLGWFLALLVLFVLVVIDSSRPRWRVTALVLLWCSIPGIALMLNAMLFLYWSYDANPWMQAVSGGSVVLAAGAVWWGTGARRTVPAPSPVGHDLAPEAGGALA